MKLQQTCNNKQTKMFNTISISSHAMNEYSSKDINNEEKKKTNFNNMDTIP